MVATTQHGLTVQTRNVRRTLASLLSMVSKAFAQRTARSPRTKLTPRVTLAHDGIDDPNAGFNDCSGAADSALRNQLRLRSGGLTQRKVKASIFASRAPHSPHAMQTPTVRAARFVHFIMCKASTSPSARPLVRVVPPVVISATATHTSVRLCTALTISAGPVLV